MSHQNAKEIIRAKLSIESVVGSYVKLEKSGKNFRACCPFHSEKSPSFYVTPDRGIYYCYGCQKGGDIFSFVQEIEGVAFYEALKILAEKAGVTLEKGSADTESPIGILREIMETATKFYEVGLRTEKAPVEYLMSRGLTKDTMVSWRVGYAKKGWSGLADTLKKKGYRTEDIIRSGLCIAGNHGLYDRFRERIMFPIMDPQGRVIAFTGRVLPGTEEATRPVGKYINSPETDLYHKSKVLFGFDKAKTAIHAQNFVILVEGQMDVIMSHQVGVTNVVALSGTASTDLHMEQIKRFTENVAICLDADNAGLAAAQKTAMVAYAHDMRVLAIDISSGKDPADMILENAAQWNETIKKRKDIITFRLEKMRARNQDAEKLTIARNELFPILAYIKSEILLDDRLKEIAHYFGSTSVDPVRKEFERYLKNKDTEFTATTTQANALATPNPKPDDAKVQMVQRLVGIILLGTSPAETQDWVLPLKDLFNRYADPDNQGLYMSVSEALSETDRSVLLFQLEEELGKAPDAIPRYIKTFTHEVIRYRMRIITELRAACDQQLRTILARGDAPEPELLKKMHQLQVEKDELMRSIQ